MLGTSEYYLEDFDFAHFYAVQARERDDLLLDVGEGWSIAISTKNKVVLDRQWIGDVPDFLERREQYRLSRWIDDKFQIVDPFDRVVHELDARPYLNGL